MSAQNENLMDDEREELISADPLEETLKAIIRVATGHDCGDGGCRQAKRAMPLFKAALGSRWQLIDTAPHDRTILLWWPSHHDEPVTGRWGRGTGWNSDGFTSPTDPTHWMPLPQAPTAVTGSSKQTPSDPDLLRTAKELLEACAAAMRVIAEIDTPTRLKDLLGTPESREQALMDELRISGVGDGFGIRAKAVIAKAEGRSE